MTREETKECIKIMQAFADNKPIQYYEESVDKWFECLEPIWNWVNIKYRIAHDQEPKEKHYRPYTMEEFVEEMHKHDGFVRLSSYCDDYGISFYAINLAGITLTKYGFINYDALQTFVWSDDGSVCGKEVTE